MKTCKKLFSLLLVAVMLVAAIPTFAFAADVTGANIKAVCGATTVGTGTLDLTNFDVADKTHLKNALDYSHISETPANFYDLYEIVDGTLSGNDLTINLRELPQWQVVVTGSATETGKKLSTIDAAAQTDYGVLFATMSAAGLDKYMDANKYTVKSAVLTGKTLTVTVEDVTPAPAPAPGTGTTTPGSSTTTPGTGTTTPGSSTTTPGTSTTTPGSSTTTPGTSTTTPGTSTTTPGTSTTTPGSSTTTPGTSTTTPASYSKVVVVYCDENGNVKTNAGKTVILTTPYTGSTANNDAQGILNHAGVGESVNNYASATVAVSGDTITVTLTDKVDTRYVLNLTVVSGTTTTPKTYKAAYTGSVDTMSVLKGFGVDKEFNLDNYTYSTLGYDNAKTFTLTMTAKPTAADKYTVNCIVNGVQFASKTDVTYVGSFESNITNAQAILNAAGIQKTASEYKKVTITKSNTNVITVDLRNTVVVRVYNNANSYSEVTMDVGQPYVNYLGTNLINNSTFGGITVKDTSDRNTYYSASQVNGRTALVSAFDKEITIQRNGDSCTLYFLRSDGTVLESRKLYAGDQIGTLPSYIVGNVPATWTYNGKPISATDVYNFKTTSVNIVPYFGGISDVYVDVYTNGNVKTMQTRVKVTDLVQNGVLYLNSEVKSAISSALRNTSNKNLTYTAFFDASTWSDFIKTKNTNGAAEPIRVGDNSERQGAVYLYVMVNNVTQKAADSTNPKTGDDVKLGVAAAVLAVAVVGFGAAIVIKKKKGVQ